MITDRIKPKQFVQRCKFKKLKRPDFVVVNVDNLFKNIGK